MEMTSSCLLCSPHYCISRFSLTISNTRVQTGLGSAGPRCVEAIAADTSVWCEK